MGTLKPAKDLPTINRLAWLTLTLAWLMFFLGVLIGFIVGRFA